MSDQSALDETDVYYILDSKGVKLTATDEQADIIEYAVNSQDLDPAISLQVHVDRADAQRCVQQADRRGNGEGSPRPCQVGHDEQCWSSRVGLGYRQAAYPRY